MFIQLVSATSAHPDFKPPTLQNGEDMELMAVEASGSYMMLRYVGDNPVAAPGGPVMEHILTDVYCNDQGAEAFRVNAKFYPAPPPPLTFGGKLTGALRTLTS